MVTPPDTIDVGRRSRPVLFPFMLLLGIAGLTLDTMNISDGQGCGGRDGRFR